MSQKASKQKAKNQRRRANAKIRKEAQRKLDESRYQHIKFVLKPWYPKSYYLPLEERRHQLMIPKHGFQIDPNNCTDFETPGSRVYIGSPDEVDQYCLNDLLNDWRKSVAAIYKPKDFSEITYLRDRSLAFEAAIWKVYMTALNRKYTNSKQVQKFLECYCNLGLIWDFKTPGLPVVLV